jgi:membrane fusion protein, macrolide-specific efflux system
VKLRMTKRHWAMMMILVLAVAYFSVKTIRPAKPPRLATSPAVLADIEDTVIATGTLESSQLVSVGAQASGQIRSLKVQVGQQVEVGAVIAEIDSTTQHNALRTAEALVISSNAQITVQRVNLELAELNYQRQRSLLAEGAITRQAFEDAEATYKSARAQLESIEAQQVQVQRSLDTARANLGYTQITAPIRGTVVAIVAREGQTVNAVQSSPTIVKLAKLDIITVTAGISEADVVRVRPGQTVYFTILGNPLKRYYSILRSVAPAPSSIEQDTGGRSLNASGGATQAVYYNAIFEVPNAEGELRMGMTAQVNVVLAEARQALVIPSAALSEQAADGSYTVQVLDALGLPKARHVTVGINNHVTAQILTGLSAGEQLVVGMATEGTRSNGSGIFGQ